jgi:hypothetical protein
MTLTVIAACSRSAPQPTPTAAVVEQVLTIDQIEAKIWGAGPKATFAASTIAETEELEMLVPELVEANGETAHEATWAAFAKRAEFRLEKWRVGNDVYLALVEQKVHGAGAYIFRVGPRGDGPTILLEAPHNYFDLGTGRLAAELFFTPRAGARPRALFTNTMHRYQLAPGDKGKRAHNPADIAHEPEHAFSVATVKFARKAGPTHVIQLHGFSARSDEDEDGDLGAIGVVVSAGNRDGSSPVSSAIAQALAAIFDGVKRFPEDAKVLGATTNAQGKLLRDVKDASFVHVEMSSAVRKQLANSSALRERLAAALFDARSAAP